MDETRDPHPHAHPGDPVPAGAPGSGRLLAWGIALALHSLALIAATLVVAAITRPEPRRDGLVHRTTVVVPEPTLRPRDRPEPRPDPQAPDLALPPATPEAVAPTVLPPIDGDLAALANLAAEEADAPRRQEAVGEHELGGRALLAPIGAGGGGLGLFANRQRGNQMDALRRHQGSKRSQTAVDQALEWLHRHQDADGAWDAQRYVRHCQADGPSS